MTARPNSRLAELGQFQRHAGRRIHPGRQRGTARGDRLQDQRFIDRGANPVWPGRFAIDGDQGVATVGPVCHHAGQLEAAGGHLNRRLWCRSGRLTTA